MASARLFGNAAVICASSSRLSAWRAILYPSLPLYSVRLVANMWVADTSSVEIIFGDDPADDGKRSCRSFDVASECAVREVREASVEEMAACRLRPECPMVKVRFTPGWIVRLPTSHLVDTTHGCACRSSRKAETEHSALSLAD